MRRVVVKTCLSLCACVTLFASLMHCAAKHNPEEEVVTSAEAVLQYCDMVTWPGLQDECAMLTYQGQESVGHHIYVDLSPEEYLVIPHIPMSQTAVTE